MSNRARVLFLGNGHGEDTIAVRIIDRLVAAPPPGLEISAWPMVGRGETFQERGVATIGEFSLLPSCGFTTTSWRWFWRDVRAGWVGTYVRQAGAARALRGRFDLAVAIGDVIPLAAALLCSAPFIFVGCAKSARYGLQGRYFGFEKRWLAQRCLCAFPRDEETADDLARAGVPVRFVGNPMMDDLDDSGRPLPMPIGAPVVGLLPGSRTDAVDNAVLLLAVAAAIGNTVPVTLRPHFALAAASSLDLGTLSSRVITGAAGSGWHVDQAGTSGDSGLSLHLVHERGAEVWCLNGRFADTLHRSAVVVGVAGTANEQAIGIGAPLVTFPTPGIQGSSYVQMKMRYFGEAAVAVAPDPATVARTVADLLVDPARRARMADAGRRIMGGPGASDAIAAFVRSALEERQPEP